LLHWKLSCTVTKKFKLFSHQRPSDRWEFEHLKFSHSLKNNQSCEHFNMSPSCCIVEHFCGILLLNIHLVLRECVWHQNGTHVRIMWHIFAVQSLFHHGWFVAKTFFFSSSCSQDVIFTTQLKQNMFSMGFVIGPFHTTQILPTNQKCCVQRSWGNSNLTY